MKYNLFKEWCRRRCLPFYGLLTNSAILFVTHFVHNVAATVSYDGKELLDIRTAITHLELDSDSFFNESDAKDYPRPGTNPRHQLEEMMEIIGEWVNRLYHPFYWPMCNH